MFVFDLVALKSTIKELAAEQAAHRKTAPRDARWLQTRAHIRSGARSALLLYAFLREVPYTALERKRYEAPPLWEAASRVTQDAAERELLLKDLKTWSGAASS